MEALTIIIWHRGTSAMVTEHIAGKYGLTRGQQVTDSALFDKIVEDSISQTAYSLGKR